MGSEMCIRDRVGQVARAALDGATVALARTPDELPALAAAHVVDAGAAGYVVALRHLVLTCGLEAPEAPGLQWLGTDGHGGPLPGHAEAELPAPADDTTAEDGEGHPEGAADADLASASDSTLEVVLGLTLSEASARRADRLVKRLRRRLTDLGDSVVVAGAGRHWRVHVHVADARTASRVTALCRRAGDVADVRVEGLDGSHERRREVALLVAASGEGLVGVLRAAGAQVVQSSPGRRAGIGELVQAAEACGATRVVLLPADSHLVLPAQEAARQVAQRGVWLQVVECPSLQGAVAAVAVWDPAGDVEKSVRAVAAAASSTTDGAVRALEGGRVVGLVGGREVSRAEDVPGALAEVIAALPTRGVELATVVLGEGQDPSLGKVVESSLRLRRRSLEVQVIEGGPAAFPVLVGVE